MTESDDDDEETRTNFESPLKTGIPYSSLTNCGPASRKTPKPSVVKSETKLATFHRWPRSRRPSKSHHLRVMFGRLENQPNQHQVIVLECEHVFCKSCVIPWFQLRGPVQPVEESCSPIQRKTERRVFAAASPEEVPSVVVAKEEKDAPRERDVEAAVPA